MKKYEYKRYVYADSITMGSELHVLSYSNWHFFANHNALHANAITTFYYRAMLCIRGTSHGPVSVHLSVCPSQVGVLLKRLKVRLHNA